MDKQKIKCRYCGHAMSIRPFGPPHKNTILKLQYECAHCGALGPAQFRCYRDASDVDEAKRKLDIRMIGTDLTVGNDDIVDNIRNRLQIASGMYAGLKSGDLPSSELHVAETYKKFKEVSFRRKGQSFENWIDRMYEACKELNAALKYRKRSLARFVDVKKELRRLQKDLRDEKMKRKEEEDGNGGK